MKLRFALLILVSFVAGFMQAALDLIPQQAWQLPVAVSLAVFLVYLGTYPKKQLKQEANLKTLFQNGLQLEQMMSTEALQKFEGPDKVAATAPQADPSRQIEL